MLVIDITGWTSVSLDDVLEMLADAVNARNVWSDDYKDQEPVRMTEQQAAVLYREKMDRGWGSLFHTGLAGVPVRVVGSEALAFEEIRHRRAVRRAHEAVVYE